MQVNFEAISSALSQFQSAGACKTGIVTSEESADGDCCFRFSLHTALLCGLLPDCEGHLHERLGFKVGG